jgi:tight adherence protein C
MSTGMIALLSALLTFMIGYFVASLGKRRKINLMDKLQGGVKAEIEDMLSDHKVSDTAYGKFYAKYFKPFFDRNPAVLQKISQMLGLNMESLDAQIKRAKMEKTITPEEVLSLKLIGWGGLVMFMSLGLMSVNLSLIMLGIVIYFAAGALPQRTITRKIEERKRQIIKELPNFLDLLKCVTEAGLGIQEAIEKVCKRTKGPVAEEFQSVVIETRARGGQWKLAMENMAFRNEIEQLTDVVSDILIAYEKGTPISETLHKEAKMMRSIKNAQIQEEARRLNVKLLIPMAIFSFMPLLFLMLTPMVLQLMQGLL